MSEYIKPNVSDVRAVDIIKEKIKTLTPFCLTRFGDGEIYLINNNAPKFLIDKIIKLWGLQNMAEYNKFRQECVKNIFEKSFNYSDMLGFMSPNNNIAPKIKYDKNKWSLPINYLYDIRKTSDIIVCDHQITRSRLLGDIKNFSNVLQGRSLNIISPNDFNIDLLSNILQTTVTCTKISNNRNNLLQQIRTITSDVVIFGASITGKDIGVELKNMGKVALDFGATLDAWAGIKSRSWFADDGIQNYCMVK